MKIRDLSKKQFAAALQRYGMKFEGFLGYVDLGIPGHSIAVSIFGAGPSRRSRLAYLIKRKAEYEAKLEKEGAA